MYRSCFLRMRGETMDFVYIKVAIMAKGNKRKTAYSEADILRLAIDGYQLVGYETEWI